MRSRLLVAVISAVAMIAPAMLAETSKGALSVSVTVTRSCTVTTDGPTAHVDCGTRPQPVQIASVQLTPGSAAAAPHAARSITVEF